MRGDTDKPHRSHGKDSTPTPRHRAGSAAWEQHTPDLCRTGQRTHAAASPQPSSAVVSIASSEQAPPLQIEPASLGFDLGQERRQGRPFPHAISVLTAAKSNRDSLTPPRYSPLKRLCVQGLPVLFSSYRWNDRRKSSGNRHRRQWVYCALLNT